MGLTYPPDLARPAAPGSPIIKLLYDHVKPPAPGGSTTDRNVKQLYDPPRWMLEWPV
jgi:hypothetical protein